jgi:hypothetical protein
MYYFRSLMIFHLVYNFYIVLLKKIQILKWDPVIFNKIMGLNDFE